MAKEILSAQHAQDEKAKLEKIIAKLKLPLLISVICSAVVYLAMKIAFSDAINPESFLALILSGIAFIGVIGVLIADVLAIVFGGLTMLKLFGKILFWGFLLLPVPVNLFVGLFTFCMMIMAFIGAPWAILLIAFIKMKWDIKKYDEYLMYNPDSFVQSTGNI